MEKIIGMAYARVSTDDQAEYSPTVQIETIMEYAQKNNIYIPKEYIFVDEGISGKSASNRPAFQQMIRTARKKTNNVKVIIVHKFDRFSRKKDDQVLYKALLKKDGIKVISVKEPIPDDDKFAVIYESMLEAMAEYYSLNLAEEVKKTMVVKAKNGEYQAPAPFGYKNENKTLAIVPDEASIVKEIYKKYLDGESILSITDFVNAMGFKTHRGNVFENRTVQYILNNPVYCGYVRWTPSGRIRRDFYSDSSLVVKGSHPSIISEETFKKASEKWKTGRAKSTFHQRPLTEGKHYLSGIIKCSSCGRSLIISHSLKNGGFTMQCGGYNHGQCKDSHYLSSSQAINAVLDAIKHLIDYYDFGNFNICFIPVIKNEDSRKVNELLLSKAKRRLIKAKEAYLAGVDSLDEYRQNKQNIEAEISTIEEKIQNCKNLCKNPLQNKQYIAKLECLYDVLQSESADMEIKKTSIREVVEKIVYNKKENSFSLYLYDS